MDPDATPLTDLVCRCLESGQADAWEALIARVQPILARVVYRVAAEWRQPELNDLDDVLQDIFLKVGANHGEFLRKLPLATEQSALAYLKTSAANCARDHFSSLYAARRSASKTVELDVEGIDFHAAFDAESGMDRALLLTQVDQKLEANDRDRTIFWLYYRQGFSAREISEVPHLALTAKGVESVIHQLTAALRRKFAGKGDSAVGPS